MVLPALLAEGVCLNGKISCAFASIGKYMNGTIAITVKALVKELGHFENVCSFIILLALVNDQYLIINKMNAG
ncbi:hypothetical protein [Pararhodonellum marinum]|uniref:hypothetical protein n=1 Tax=Pararhodonellum marinum TaxID=2755358 RepID=UPI00189007F6|nr:hypothetical protein [Pararhodonellum marinum]